MQCWNCFQEKNSDSACEICGYDSKGTAQKYPFALQPGSILNGRYTVGRVLGQGGFGITYIALDEQAKQRTAIKEFFPAGFASRASDGVSLQIFDEDQRESFEYGRKLFLEEAKTLAAMLDSNNIVHIHSYFEENNTAYFVMEYIDGQPLNAYVSKHGGRLGTSETLHLLLPLMEALETVHSQGIVHRDIAPDNILVTDNGTAKLIDFGAARYSTGEKSQSLDIIIKHGFAAYEQYMRRGRQGPWTDVYGFAATFYYAITGKIPPESIERMDQDALLTPSKLGVEISRQIENVLLKALSVSASDRFQDMREFRRALLTASSQKEEKSQKVRADTAKKKSRHSGIQKLLFLLVSLLAISVAAYFTVTKIVIPAKAYRNAQSLLEAGNYEEAVAAFTALGDYQDAEKQAQNAASYQHAEVLLEAGQYTQAIEIFLGLGDYRDAPEQALIATYRYAESLVAAGQYTEAAAVFEKLGDYLDSAYQLEMANAYLAADALEASGQLHKAYTSFTALGEYGDAAKRAGEIALTLRKSYGVSIAAGYAHTAVLCSDGTVLAAGHNSSGECEVAAWTDIVSVSAGRNNTAGLRADGTVVVTGDNTFGQCDVSDWTDIVAISEGASHTVGLRADGTAVATGLNNFGQCNVKEWRDIIAIAAGGHTVGLRADGTVLAVGDPLDGRCDVEDWKDIVAIAASHNTNGSHTVGIRADGTVLATGYNFYKQCEVSDWTDIVAVAAGGCHTIGLRADGTVVAAGEGKFNSCNVSGWSDIIAIASSRGHTIGLTADGTIVTTGDNRSGQLNVSTWQNIAPLKQSYLH